MRLQYPPLFNSTTEMFEVLEAGFGDPNRKRNACAALPCPTPRHEGFFIFWAEFQPLASESDHSEETLIDDLIDKSHHSIQQAGDGWRGPHQSRRISKAVPTYRAGTKKSQY